ncbi:MAG: 4-(cytidine 5'-diphospho)-2-C-methyl-D-erythritol kinase [Cyanobacteria bacterium J06634_6]
MLTLFANAKINLYLEIIGSRPDGFHELVMVMQSVDLADRITLKPLNTPTIRINCDHPQVPTDSTNLAYKAVALVQKRFPNRTNQRGGMEITIDKKIPVGAGLAGGSANAAAVLFGLNMLWDLGLTRAGLQELSAELGSDIPFCLAGGCAIATGRGENIGTLRKSSNLFAVLAKYESTSVSTPWAYKTYRAEFGHTYQDLSSPISLEDRRSRIHAGKMIEAVSAKNAVKVGAQLHNDLEKVVLPANPKVNQLKDTMADIAKGHGGLGTMMSGSGPTVFTLTDNLVQAGTIQREVRSHYNDPDLKVYVAPFTSHGIVVKPV